MRDEFRAIVKGWGDIDIDNADDRARLAKIWNDLCAWTIRPQNWGDGKKSRAEMDIFHAIAKLDGDAKLKYPPPSD